ncbi:MAG: hypothetical protein J5605_09470, partial [Bacteroidales bacterium]|nr:hypothetical protein [Bacteroidales bacterium]
QLIALYQISPFSFGIQTDEDKQGAVLPAEEFMQANFSSAILRLFQLAMQANKANEEVFAFCDWKRHEYVDEELHEYEFIREKAELLLKQSHSEVLVPMAAAKLASIMIDECNKEDEQLRWRKKEARDLLKKVIEDYPNSPVLTECQYMLNGIESVSLSAKTEYTVPRNQRSLIRIEHKNIDEVAARLYYLNEDCPTRYYNAEEIHKFCKNKPIAKEWKQPLKNEGDYLEYSTEVVVPALEKAGFYVLEISANDVVSYSIFQVSDLAVVWEPDGRVNDQTRFRVLNRVTGLPIADAQVKIFNRNTNKTQTTLHTDKNGRAVWSSSRSYADAISVSYKDDHWIAEDYVSTDSKSAFRPGTNTRFYLDRAIYRPGQKVNFKLYYIQHTNPNVYITNPKQIVKVVLKDANYKQRAEIEVHTNEFGTASGEFVLPNDGLLGTWRICLADGGWGDCVSFRVEEYKRPTFEVQMLPIEGTFKMGEKITVKGQAKAYAGNAIDGAKVHYKVVRKENRFSWWWYEPVRDEQITTGETTTDANGDFSITFCAEAPVVQSKYKHSYRYVVSVDATDISGETRSAETGVNVSEFSVFLGVEVDELLFGKPETNTMHIVTSNAAGNVVPAKVALRIYKTIEPKNIVKKRYWMRPDYVISRELHDSDFPTFEYDHETDPMQWKRGEIVAEKQLTSDGDTVFALDFLPDGFYQYETETLNDAGEVVSTSGRFRILRMEDAKHAAHIGTSTPLLLFAENTTVKAGEKAVFYIGSAAKNAQVFYEIMHADKVLQEGRVKIDNEVITLEQPVDTSLCGEIHIAAYMVLDNRYYDKALTVSVPFDYKNLQVHWQTFRSTLFPGQQEKWTLQITDNAGKVKPTELLASMYDASLDAFAPNKWFMHLYSPIYSRLSFNGLNFGDTHSNIALSFEDEFFFSTFQLTAPSINFPFGYYGSRRF